MTLQQPPLKLTPFLLTTTLVILALASSVYLSRGNPLDPRTNCETILQTNKPLCGPFLDYWTAHGGADIQGFPVSAQFPETSTTDGQIYQVQYFEKAVFTLQPESPTGKVQLVPLGTLRFNELYPNGTPTTSWDQVLATLPPSQTEHNIEEPFLSYWRRNGGDTQFGPPISKPFTEQIDGKPYKVQYYERAKLELHPEQGQSKYQVLPASLGAALFAQRYPNGEPTP